MKSLASFICKEIEPLEKHPFFQFLRDDSIPAEERLAYAPYSAFFILTFADVNRFLLPDKASTDPLQQLVNRHAAEDAQHWVWYLADLESLGWSPQARFTDVLRFVWGDTGHHMREAGYFLAHSVIEASPMLKVALLEGMEAAGRVWLTATAPVSRGLGSKHKLVYFADHHLERETGHIIGSSNQELESITLTDDVRAEAERLIRELYRRLIAFSDEILSITRAVPIHLPAD